QVSRELMYNWFNKHLQLGQPESVVEKPFVPVPPRELSVYDEQHPRPKDATDAAGLRKYQTKASDKQLAALHPKELDSLKEFKNEVGTALRVMVHDRLPEEKQLEVVDNQYSAPEVIDGVKFLRTRFGRKGFNEEVPAVLVTRKVVDMSSFDFLIVFWIHPEGKKSLFKEGRLVPAARKILDSKAIIIAPDVY